MVGFAVTLYRSTVDLPEVPPVYATASVVDDSLASALREGMANYSRGAVSAQSVCGGENEQAAQSVFESALVSFSPVYSGEGFAVESEQSYFSMCYIQFNSTSGVAYSRASATVVYSLSSLGLRSYTGYVTFSYIAYVSCSFSDGANCTVTETEETTGQPFSVTGLNVSYFYANAGGGWVPAASAVDHQNGTYSVYWPTLPQSGTVAVAIENGDGVFAEILLSQSTLGE